MSTIGSISDQVITILEADTDVTVAVKGLSNFASDKYPIAQIAFDNGEIEFENIQGPFKVHINLYVMVDGNSFEEVQAILEDALTVFLTETNFQSLVALGIIDIRPVLMLPPINFEGNYEFWRGAVHYDIEYKVVYAS